jgi:hypothetical protein
MIGYASRTGTKRNLSALRKAGWGLMVSAKGVLRSEGFSYCLDNGAWWSFANKQPFDETAFLKAYELMAVGANFVVLPDIVAGGVVSLDFSLGWRHRLGRPTCLQLLAVQDGMDESLVAPLVGPELGIFVGGTTEWKERMMALWGTLAKMRNAYLHVGRVNSARRVALAAAAGADSFDGSSVSRFAVTLPVLNFARCQPDLFRPI